jgi:hypothetical protein
MRTTSAYLLVLLLIFPLGCRNAADEPSESVRKMRTCKRFMEDSAAVMLTLRKGMNGFELEALENDRRLGLPACLLKHPDLPGRCMDLSSRESIRNSVDLATSLCISWPDKLVDCLTRQDQDSRACQKALESFRGKD